MARPNYVILLAGMPLSVSPLCGCSDEGSDCEQTKTCGSAGAAGAAGRVTFDASAGGAANRAGAGALGGEDAGLAGSAGAGGAAGMGGEAAAAAGGASGAGGVSGAGGAGGTSGSGAGGTGGTGPCVAPSPPGGECDPYARCGCGVGEGCFHVQNTFACGPPGGVPDYFACSFADDCREGSSCASGCQPFCGSPADCTAPDSECVPHAQGVSFCSAPCALEAPAAVCGPGRNCDWRQPVKECIATGTGVGANACQTGSFECAPGYLCLTSLSCVEWCRIGGPASDCSSGSCTGTLMGAPTFGGFTYGYCV